MGDTAPARIRVLADAGEAERGREQGRSRLSVRAKGFAI